MTIINPTVSIRQDPGLEGRIILTAIVTPGTYQLYCGLWQRISGPDYALTDGAHWVTQMYDYAAGTFVIQYTITDVMGNTGSNTITVTTSAPGGASTFTGELPFTLA